jgi:hypothetical protein
MNIELDHLFVCASRDTPEAEELVQFGLREGAPNHHPGQGSASRRFPFLNSMIELFWVRDAGEAQAKGTRRTQLWERWSGRESGSCPYGICVRPVDAGHDEIPFPAWTYQPSYLQEPLVMHIGEAGVTEPMWVYLGFMRRTYREEQFVEHPIGIRAITGLTLTTAAPLMSAASQAMVRNEVISAQVGKGFLLEIEFDNGYRKQVMDFRPHLPLIFQY